MVFKAISLGYAIPHVDFNAVVHSVFRSAINFRLNNSDHLLTLLTSSQADLPQGIRVDVPDDFSFEIFHTCELVTCQNGILRLGSLMVELRDAQRWKCDLPALQADLTNPAVSSSWQRVWQILNQRQIQLNAEIVAQNLFRLDEGAAGVPRKAGEAMRKLFDATQRFDLTDVSAIRALIGLGSGLTPSGDDLLLGYLAGLWCSVADQDERARFISNLGDVVNRLSHRTNDISRTYLYHAARGQVSSRLSELAEAICRGENSERLLELLDSATQAGHTSGMDTISGLLIGLAVWDIRAVGFSSFSHDTDFAERFSSGEKIT